MGRVRPGSILDAKADMIRGMCPAGSVCVVKVGEGCVSCWKSTADGCWLAAHITIPVTEDGQ